MKILSLFVVAAPLLLTGCPSGGGGIAKLPGDEKPPQLCESDCEKTPLDVTIKNPNWKPLQLTPTETKSLNQAVTTSKTSSTPQHIDVSVVGGGLVFASHADINHTETATASVAIPGQHTQLKIVASPEAAALLHQHIVSPGK